MSEEHGPSDLLHNARRAEQAGFDFAAISDHFSPWIDEQGHASFAWSVLGAVANATERLGLMTAVTCPIMRYHPAIIAQAAATLALLSKNRFTLGLACRLAGPARAPTNASRKRSTSSKVFTTLHGRQDLSSSMPCSPKCPWSPSRMPNESRFPTPILSQTSTTAFRSTFSSSIWLPESICRSWDGFLHRRASIVQSPSRAR